MPLGLISGGPTPRPRGSQSALALTVSYRRTSASVRGTPTLNCTASTATPGFEIDMTCSTPVIWPSTCSAGVATICSTSRTDAPGKGTNTLAIVTLICGSSSRGVTSTAKTPSSSDDQRQQRRDLRRLEVGGDAAGQAQTVGHHGL